MEWYMEGKELNEVTIHKASVAAGCLSCFAIPRRTLHFSVNGDALILNMHPRRLE